MDSSQTYDPTERKAGGLSFGMVARTLYHLRTGQILDRGLRRVRPLPRAPQPPGAYILRDRASVRPVALEDRASFDGDGFTFLGVRRRFQGASRWEPAGASALWIYHLHYFQYLHAVDRRQGRELIQDWIGSNTMSRHPAWQPYPISLRAREWLEWMLVDPSSEGNEPMIDSLAHQLRVLDSQLEFHLAANHLLENAITLCWAGATLHGPESVRWWDRGRNLLCRELVEQVLPDGMHYERSPMYQGLIAEALIRLRRVVDGCGQPGADELCGQLGRTAAAMVTALARTSHPDGEVALLNDSAMGVAPTWRQLESLREDEPASARPAGLWRLADAGYFGVDLDPDTYVVFDAGPIGPDYQPGHGHADTLAFELSCAGRRWFTDTGIYTYDVGPARDRDRSTRAHNTVEVDGQSHAELWGSFRCGRRPEVTAGTMVANAETVKLSGEYLYGPSGQRVGHARRIVVQDARLEFTDRITAVGSHRARLHLHLAPELSTSIGVAGDARVAAPDGRQVRIEAAGGGWSTEETPYHPRFGAEVVRPTLVADVDFRDSAVLTWRIHLPRGGHR